VAHKFVASDEGGSKPIKVRQCKKCGATIDN
jgi:hypothetical protein